MIQLSIPRFVSVLTVFATALVLAMPAWSASPSVTLTTHDLPPYSFPVEQSVPGGIAVQTVQCAANALSIPINIEFFPWKRAQLMVQNNSADGFFAASQSDQRDAYAVLSATVAPQEWRWYLLKSSAMDPSSATFKQTARTSSFLGANMREWLVENGYKANESPPRNSNLLAMLLSNRVDAILANRLVMEQLLAQSGKLDSVKSYLAMDKPLGIYFSKAFLATQPPDYLARWNLAINTCTGQNIQKRPTTKARK